MGVTGISGWSSSLADTVAHVWGGDDQVDVVVAGTGRPGWQNVERYRLAPDARRARFILPATSRRAAAGSIRSYNQLRLPRTRWARSALGAIVAAGGAGLLRDRVDVIVDPEVPTRELADHVLTRFVATVLGGGAVEFGVGVHDQTPNSKPTLQAFSSDGSPRGFAKVGWNSVTQRQVSTEASALRLLTGSQPGVDTPTLLHAGAWRGRELLITAPMPSTVRRWVDVATAPDAAVVDKLAQSGRTAESTVRDSARINQLRQLARSPQWDPEVARAATALLDRITTRYGAAMLRFGAWHGDWVPWNLARHRGRLMVWDWEQFRDSGIAVGLDTIHWHFQVSFVLQREPLATALRKAYRRAATDLERLQGAGSAAVCHALYALELTTRYEEMRAAGAGPTDRFHEDIVRALDAIGRDW